MRPQDAGLAELQSFTDLIYSKNKIAAALQWLPHQRGFIAVAAIDALPFVERAGRMGRPNPAYVLVWNFRDPIHPEYVMEAPHEVVAFQYNPSNPNIVAGGCYNGQVRHCPSFCCLKLLLHIVQLAVRTVLYTSHSWGNTVRHSSCPADAVLHSIARSSRARCNIAKPAKPPFRL